MFNSDYCNNTLGELPLRVGWGKKLLKRVGKFDNSSEGLIFLLD